MKSLLESLREAEGQRVALGHFNVSELTVLKAVTGVGARMGVPVILGVSEGERAYLGVREIAALVDCIRQGSNAPIYLDADHTHNLSGVQEAARAGFDMIVFDASELALEENIARTREAVEAAKAIRETILVEGEIGFIGSGSQIHQERTAPAVLTDPETARQFTEATGVDILAPALGTMHGMLRAMVAGTLRKRVDALRVAEIKAATGKFLTLHGGSGTADDDFRKAIAAGVNIVHINTEVRLAWRRGIEAALVAHPEEIVPYKLLLAGQAPVEQVVCSRLALFNSRSEPNTTSNVA
jgi:fructose-bisphosphate aldolase, class II